MQSDVNTASKKRQEKTRLSTEQTELVISSEAKKPTSFTFAISVPAEALTRCLWCQQIAASVLLASGVEQLLDLELEFEDDPDTQRPTVSGVQALLTSPHTCLPFDRDVAGTETEVGAE